MLTSPFWFHRHTQEDQPVPKEHQPNLPRQVRCGLTLEEMGLREEGSGQISVLLGGIGMVEQKDPVGQNGNESQP